MTCSEPKARAGTQKSHTQPFLVPDVCVNLQSESFINVNRSSVAGEEKPDGNVSTLHVRDTLPGSRRCPGRQLTRFNGSCALDFYSQLSQENCTAERERERRETQSKMSETSRPTTPSVWMKQFCSFPSGKGYCLKRQTKIAACFHTK